MTKWSPAPNQRCYVAKVKEEKRKQSQFSCAHESLPGYLHLQRLKEVRRFDPAKNYIRCLYHSADKSQIIRTTQTPQWPSHKQRRFKCVRDIRNPQSSSPPREKSQEELSLSLH